MPGILKRRSTPPILALSAVVVLVVAFVLLNGSGSQGADNAGLAEYMPTDSLVYAETDLKPDGRVDAEVDEAVRTLTGSSFSAALDEAFGRSGRSGIDYREDVEPWLAGPVAVATGDSRREAGLVARADDLETAGAFVKQLERREDLPAGTRAGIVGDAMVVAGSQVWLDRITAAYQGESLAETPLFGEAMDDLPEGGVASLFISNEELIGAIESDEFAASSILKTLGIDPEGTATAMTLVVEGDSISLSGSSGLAAGDGVTGAGDLIRSFPADSLLAAGSGDVGESLSALIEAVDETGAVPEGSGAEDPGPDEGGADQTPGAAGIDGLLGQASAFGIDLPGLVTSLESAGVFVTGGPGESLGGALVATTSDPDLVGDSIRSIATFGAFAGGDLFKPLPDGIEGFSIALPGMGSDRVAVALEGDRLVIASGVGPVRKALSPGNRTLGDTDLYRQASSAFAEGELSLFATPSAFAPLVRDKAGKYAAGPASKDRKNRMVRLVEAIETVAAGSGGDGSFEVELGLRD